MSPSVLLPLILLAQIDPSPNGLAQMIQTYGGWGLSTILMAVIAFLFGALMKARDKNDVTLEAQVKAAELQVKGATSLVEELTKTAVETRHSTMNMTDALRALERRLENVEKRLS